MGTNPKKYPPPVPALCMDCIWFSLQVRIACQHAELLEARCVEFLVELGVVPPALLSQTAFAALRWQAASHDAWSHRTFVHRET